MPLKSVSKRQRGEGSSSQVRYDVNSFSSIEAFELFEKKFKSRSVTLGRKVMFEDFASLNLKEIFDFQGWRKVCSLQLDVFPRMIRIFYANLAPLGTDLNNNFDGVWSYVGGKQIVMDFDLMNKLFKIPNRGPNIYGSRVEIECEDYDRVATMNQVTGLDFQANPLLRFRANQLNPLAKILLNIISNFLLPKKGHRDEVSYLETLFLDRLINHKPINLNYVIFKHILEIANSPNTSLHYGMIIQAVLNHFRVDCSNEGEIMKFKPLINIVNAHSVKRMGLVQYEDGMWDFEGRDRDEEGNEEEQEFNRQEEPVLGQEDEPPTDSLYDLRRDFNDFRVSVDSNFARVFQHQELFQQQQEEMMNMLRAMQPRPPPEE